MQAPTATTTTESGSTGGQYHTMGQPASSCNNCPGGRRDQAGPPARGIESSSTVSGEVDVSTALASLFAPGSLDQDDALLLWTGVNTVLFATLIYLEVVADG